MNTRVRLTKEFTFETGHALYGYDGLCKNVHGHSYKLAVTVIGTPLNDPSHVKHGMVMDFSVLKGIVKAEVITPFDHATILNASTPHAALADQMEAQGHKIQRVNYQPTCENMIVDFAARIQKQLPDTVQLYALKLRETGTAYAEWFAHDQ